MADNKVTNREDRVVNILAIIAAVVFFFIMGAMLFTSCAVTKPQPSAQTDSVRVEIRERIVHDSVYFEVPVEVEKVVTRDTASHLENSLALSDAVVSGGFLFHSLATKPQKVAVPVTVTVTDTLVVEKEGQTIYETEYVEKELTWWQSFRMGAFWWLVLIALVGWRREILALVKAIIKLIV